MRKLKAYMVKRDTTFFQEGDIVYDCIRHDYGCSKDDEFATGLAHTVVTERPDGDYPFRTIPTSALEEITGLD